MSASSALRCRVSSNSRAFSSATLRLPGERRQEADVRLAERVLAVDVLQGDPAGRLTPDDEGDVRPRTSAVSPVTSAPPELRDRAPWNRSLMTSGSRGLEHMCARTAVRWRRLVGETDASLERVRVVDQAGFPIRASPMSMTCASKISWMPVADEVVHRLHLEVLGEASLDVVDERELGVALTGLLEQPGVLERDAEAARERREQPDVALAERVLAVEVLERDAAGRLTADDERDAAAPRLGISPRSHIRCRPARRSVPRRARRAGAAPASRSRVGRGHWASGGSSR